MAESDHVTFLLADGDMENLDVYAGFLQEMGYFNYLEAEDGAEAWSMIQNFKIDFIICYLEIPQVNGLSLLRVIRTNEDFSSIPFILVAGAVTPKLVNQAGKIGVSDIIVHPFLAQVFKRKITEILDMEKDPKIQEAERTYKKGLELMKAGRDDEALKTFEDILTIHENAEVYFNIGYIKAGKGDLEGALKFFRKATRINNDFAKAYKQMGEIYLKLGQVDEAEKAMTKAADVYMDRKDDREAEEAFQLVVKLKPDTTNVYNSLGIIYRRQGRLNDAVEQYKKALKVHPDDEHVYYNLGRVYLDLKDFENADLNLKKALELSPDFNQARELSRAVELGLTLPT